MNFSKRLLCTHLKVKKFYKDKEEAIGINCINWNVANFCSLLCISYVSYLQMWSFSFCYKHGNDWVTIFFNNYTWNTHTEVSSLLSLTSNSIKSSLYCLLLLLPSANVGLHIVLESPNPQNGRHLVSVFEFSNCVRTSLFSYWCDIITLRRLSHASQCLGKH